MMIPMNNPDASEVGARRPWGELAALAVYGVLLFVFRPLDPFEWDEVLFQRALDHYDVASHSPHPPGYPLYVAIGRVVRFLVGNPQLALQLVGIASALAALALTWLLARRLGAPRRAATLAAAVLAAVPGFIFNGDIGMSDVPGVAAGVGAALLFALAWERPWLLVAAAAASGAISGIRPANLIVALPFAIAALAAVWRRRGWWQLALAPPAFAAAAAAVWVPAMLVTGPARFIGAVSQQSDYIERTWTELRLPGAPVRAALTYWGVRWLGPTPLVVLLWVVILLGGLAWWRNGRRRLAVTAGLAAGAFLAFAAFALEYKVAMRYALPAAPFLALLAAGVGAIRRPAWRLVAEAAAVVWVAGTVVWVAPALPIRLRPAPVWQALKYVRASFDPASTRVVIDGVIGPHSRYLLEPAGFRIEAMKSGKLAETLAHAGPDVVFVTPRPLPGTEVLFQSDWDSDLVAALTRNRYGMCAVCRKRQVAAVPQVSAAITAGRDAWLLSGTGAVRLPAEAKPAVLRVASRTQPLVVQLPGHPRTVLAPGETLSAILFPGAAGEVRISAPPGVQAVLDPIVLTSVSVARSLPGLAPAFVVPQVAHTDGSFGSRWRTDLFVFNPNPFGITVTLLFLPTGRANPEAPAADLELAPGESASIPDVVALSALDGPVRSGALVLEGRATESSAVLPAVFAATSRTYNLNAAGTTGQPGDTLPAVPLGDGLCITGKAVFRGVTISASERVNLGLVGLADAPVTVRVLARDGSGRPQRAASWEMPPFGHLQQKLENALRDGSVELEVASGPAAARVFAYVSQIDRDSGAPVHSLPEITAPCPSTAPPPPLPRRLSPRAPRR
jgi:hypothetical protein